MLAHILAIVAIPYFSWSSFIACMVGVFVVAPFGVNVGYHRMLTHQGFESPAWLEHGLVLVGSMVGAGAPLVWAAEHRVHHRFSDQENDPHNSRRGFWYSHIGHLFYANSFQSEKAQWGKYVPDLLADPFLVVLNTYWIWTAIAVLPILYYFGGLSLVLWAGFMRLVLTWHIMWFVNSASHRFGYRNYETVDLSRNCWWVGLLAAGEGWHNNHHAQQSSAAHGHRWWELDLSYLIISGFEALGLAKNVKRPLAKG